MNRRTLFGRFLTAAVAFAVAPVVRAEAATEQSELPFNGFSFVKEQFERGLVSRKDMLGMFPGPPIAEACHQCGSDAAFPHVYDHPDVSGTATFKNAVLIEGPPGWGFGDFYVAEDRPLT